MIRRAALVVVGSGLSACSNCTQNAVLVAEEVQSLAPIVDTIEVYGDVNGNGIFEPEERAFVVDPAASAAKILRISFLQPVDRGDVSFSPNTSDTFIVFTALPPLSVGIDRVYFNDDPADVDLSGPPATVVTYDLQDDLDDPLVSVNVAVAADLYLDRIDPTLEPARFGFVLARQPAGGTPPRISAVSPNAPGLIGWGRPIASTDFGPGDTLADVLARVDQNFRGLSLDDRVAPHELVSLTFDDDMTNLIVSVTPSAGTAGRHGIRLEAPTIGFVTPFRTAVSDTSLGMAPDTIYDVSALSNWSVIRAPVVAGTQSADAQRLMPNFSDELYATLRTQGYSDGALSGESHYRFRTGPLRIMVPTHRSETNVASGPDGLLAGAVQFAVPAEGIEAPNELEVTVTAAGASQTTVTPFPVGAPDALDQDGFQRTTGITRHSVPFQLPSTNFDAQVDIEVVIRGAPPNSNFLGRDRIRVTHDVIVPEIDASGVTVTNDYTDGQLDELCIVADCDIDSFIVQVAGANPTTVSVQDATASECQDGIRQYCFSQVDLGIPNGSEGDIVVTITAVDDQGNVSAPVTISTRPKCQLYEKFVGAGGARLASVPRPNGKTGVAWDDGTVLRYAESGTDGQWNQRSATIHTLPPGHTYGLGIDMAVEPVSGRPTVCLVDAQIEPGSTDANSTGTLRIMQMGSQGTWFEVNSRPGVRPIGCALSVFQNQVVVGFVEPEPGSTAFLNGVPKWAPAIGVSVVAVTLPVPNTAGFRRAHTLPWELDLAGVGDHLYFSFRSANSFRAQLSAPGQIVVGSIVGSLTSFVATSQVACAPGDQCLAIGNNVPEQMLGFAPRLHADADGVALAYVRVRSVTASPGYVGYRLEVLHAPLVSSPGAALDFEELHRSDNPPPLHNLLADGLTTSPDDTPVVSVPVGIPSITTSEQDPNRLLVAWARGARVAQNQDPNNLPIESSIDFGAEDVAIASIDRTSAHTDVTVVEARVETNHLALKHTVPVSITGASDGYHLVFRNPAPNRVVFASEQETRPLGTTSNGFECPGAWANSPLFEEDLNLVYTSARPPDPSFVLWPETCLPLSLPRPWALAAFPNEEIGDVKVPGKPPSLLRDVAVGLSINDGRTPLKVQRNVCLPVSTTSNGEPDFTVCDPDLAGPSSFVPAVGTDATSPVQSALTSRGPSQALAFPNLAAALAGCPAGGQIVLDLSGPAECHVCPAGASYDPATAQCMSCSASTLDYGPAELVGVRPRVLIAGVHAASCVGCPVTPQGDLDRGVGRWIFNADGSACTRCTPGSVQTVCRQDDECLVYGQDARCAAPAEWSGRAGAPPTNVCVSKCGSDLDCPVGSCDAATGQCLSFAGFGYVNGDNLLCRPIGCDECWHNDYCSTDADCPVNHRCFNESPSGGGALSPVCILRPLLSPTFESFISGLVPVAISQEQFDAIQVELEEQRTQIREMLATVRIPNELEAPIPLISDTIVNVEAPIRDIQLDLIPGSGAPFRQGRAIVRIIFGQSRFQTADEFFTTTAGGWTLNFEYVLYTAPRTTTKAFSGLSFTLVAVTTDGELDVPNFPDQSLAPLAEKLRQRLDEFSSRMMDNILKSLGGLEEDAAGLRTQPSLVRCMFSALPQAVPTQCSEGDVPDVWLGATYADRIDVTTEACR